MALDESTVAEVMLRRPKTLPEDVTVADARSALEHASVKMLLLVDGSRFSGAVTSIPDDADPTASAIAFADQSPPAVTENTVLSEALGSLDSRPGGRIVVLDGERLVGLVCLTADGASFCGSPSG